MSKERKEKKIKTISGIVVSDKMTDTIIVKIESYEKHPKYGKFIKKTNKIVAHDAGNTAKEGEKVSIVETKPISKTKRFTLAK